MEKGYDVEIITRGNICYRCNHLWICRNKGKPKVCPKCKSPYWYKPKQKYKYTNN